MISHEGVSVTSMAFEVENLSWGETGMGWQGLLGRLRLRINDESIIDQDLELTSTLDALYDATMILFQEGTDEGDYFCCTCGDHGCAYIWWVLRLEDDTVFLEMENLLGEPIGDHRYVINKSTFILSIMGLLGSMADYRKAGEYVSMRENLSRYAE